MKSVCLTHAFLGAGFSWALSCAIPAEAKRLQILHTNDLHSHWEQSDQPGLGGYAALKALIDDLRREAASEGIPTLQLDGGDFSEGTENFLAENGVASWRLIESMGFDATTIGNHDWMIGPEQMDRITRQLQPKIPILGANFLIPEGQFSSLSRSLKPYVELERAGIRIGILGLTTAELVYSWRARPAQIENPDFATSRHLPGLRQRNDLVIILSHLGLSRDEKLARATSGADLILGAHSHDRLEKPIWKRRPDGHQTAIVQTGAHGAYLGKILIDVEPNKPPQWISSELIPVSSSGRKDPAIEHEIAEAHSALDQRYPAGHLDEVITVSSVDLERPLDHDTAWGRSRMEWMRKAVGADAAIDVGEFTGETIPAGPITRRDIMRSFPRVFDIDRTTGWNVWTIQMPGWLLKLVVEICLRAGLHLNTSGLRAPSTFVKGMTTLQASDIRVRGKILQPYRNYRIATSEGLGRGSSEMVFLFSAFFRPKDRGIPMWKIFEKGLRNEFSRNAATR
jgi:2',3'-cyclic-nucleotide 2'-phosphodiesterase (5'-nucleotidase family)